MLPEKSSGAAGFAGQGMRSVDHNAEHLIASWNLCTSQALAWRKQHPALLLRAMCRGLACSSNLVDLAEYSSD